MATSAILQTVTGVAGADLSSSQFLVVKQNSSAQIVLAGASDTTQVGVLQDKPASGKAGCVAVSGLTKAVAGAAVTAGVAVTSDASGKVIAATTGKKIIGYAWTAAAGANEIISVLLLPAGLA